MKYPDNRYDKTTGEWMMDQLKYMKSEYPKVFNLACKANETRRRQENKPLNYEDTLEMVVPNVVGGKQVSSTDFEQLRIAFQVANHIFNVVRWRDWKKVYSIDENLSESLKEQSKYDEFRNMILPVDVLLKLPFDSFVIDPRIKGSSIFSVFLNENIEPVIPKAIKKELGYSKGSVDTLLFMFPDPDDMTIRSFELQLFKNKSLSFLINLTEDSEKLYPMVYEMVNYLLYVVSANAEICQSEKTVQCYKPRKQNSEIKDKFSEVEEFNVGVTIGQVLKKHREASYTTIIYEEGSGSKKIPHVRRGHWHHYWTGSKKNNNRNLILKWIPPIAVNGYSGDTMSSVITPVDK